MQILDQSVVASNDGYDMDTSAFDGCSCQPSTQ